MTPTHLRELAGILEAHEEAGLLPALARLITFWARGLAPASLAPWITGAPLTPLRKRDNGVRPVAVGETLRRMTGSMLLARNKTAIRTLLLPHQLGVATSSGCEAIIHAARHFADTHGNDDRIAMLQVDLANAFNLISRAARRYISFM